MALNLIQKTIVFGCVVVAVAISGMLLVLGANREITTAVRQFTEDIPVQILESEHFNANLRIMLAHAKIYAYNSDTAELVIIGQKGRDARESLATLQRLLVEDDAFDANIAEVRTQLGQRRASLLENTEQLIARLVVAIEQGDRTSVVQIIGQIDALATLLRDLEVTSDQIALEGLADTSEYTLTHIEQGNLSVLIVLGVLVLVQLFSIFGAWRGITQPITQLAQAVARMAHDHQQISVVVTNRDEIGVLQRSFNQTAAALVVARTQVAEQQNLLEQRVAERTGELQAALDHLQAAHAAEAALRTTISDLASPVVPVLDGILIMPLIGLIDAARAQTILAALLRSVEQQRARVVLLDVTGVPIIDTQVARVLLQSASAARLLGAQVMLVGLRPELAQTVVGLGIDLTGLSAYADLQSGVRAAMGA